MSKVLFVVHIPYYSRSGAVSECHQEQSVGKIPDMGDLGGLDKLHLCMPGEDQTKVDEINLFAAQNESNQHFFNAEKGHLNSSRSWNLVKSLDFMLRSHAIHHVTWAETADQEFWQVLFVVDSEQSDELLNSFVDIGIGNNNYSDISILPISVHFPSLLREKIHEDDSNVADEKLGMFAQSIKSKMIMAQVISVVKNGSMLTFDFVMLILMASLIAAVGLVENSSVLLVASMLVSPLMGPIVGGTFGLVINYKHLWKLAIINELFGLSLCMFVGFLFGLICGFGMPEWNKLTEEMLGRGAARGLYVGVLVAIPSGAGVAFSILGGNQGSLVGVAISASLLPPAVNAGVFWAYALVSAVAHGKLSSSFYEIGTGNLSSVETLKKNKVITDYDPGELAHLGGISLTLTLVNILIVFGMGVVVLKIKEVAPGTSSAITQKFWKHDLDATRKSLKHSPTEIEDPAEIVLKEWGALNNVDFQSLKTMKGEKARKLGTQLRQIVESIQTDDRYTNVIGRLPKKPEKSVLSHRFFDQLDDGGESFMAAPAHFPIDVVSKARFKIQRLVEEDSVPALNQESVPLHDRKSSSLNMSWHASADKRSSSCTRLDSGPSVAVPLLHAAEDPTVQQNLLATSQASSSDLRL